MRIPIVITQMYDISNIRYGIDLNSALTVHNKYYIKDDPALVK